MAHESGGLKMHEQDLAIVKALVPVAWADGQFSDKEKETLEGFLAAYDATEDEKEKILGFAADKRTLDDINLQELGAADRRILLQHAVLLTYADGDPNQAETKFVVLLAAHLKIPDEEAKVVIAAAAERAKKQRGQL
jgi:tellurite resistance protein